MQTLGSKQLRRTRFHLGSHEVTDLELFQSLALLTLPLYFALSTIDTQDAFNRYIFYVALVAIAWLRILEHSFRHGIQKTKWTPRWDANFGLSECGIMLMAMGGSVAVNALLTSFAGFAVKENFWQLQLLPGTVLVKPDFADKVAWQLSLFPGDYAYFPINMQAWSQIPVLSLVSQPVANLMQQILWQTFAVGFSEETLKLGAILPFAKRFRKPWTAAGVVITTWAVAHSVRAYGNQLAPILGAIVAGFILWGVLVITESVLCAIVAHAGVNLLAIFPTVGFNVGSAVSHTTTAIVLVRSLLATIFLVG